MAFDREQFQDLIERVLKAMNKHSASAVNLLLGTAAAESDFGTYLRQIPSAGSGQAYGPALGVFQMEPATEEDIWANVLRHRRGLQQLAISAGGQIGPNVRALESNIAYQIAMARCQYLRFKEPLPASPKGFAGTGPPPGCIEALGRYWKRYWNTDQGKGTVGRFVENYNRYVEGPRLRHSVATPGNPASRHALRRDKGEL